MAEQDLTLTSPVQQALGQDENSTGPVGAQAEQVEEKPARRRRRKIGYGKASGRDEDEGIDLTADQLVVKLGNLVREEQRKRAFWIEQRFLRYAKLRGWLESKDWPWENASNQHVPIMMGNCLRVEAGLFNAALGMRPVMQAKPLRKDQKESADMVRDLIDYQFFVEGEGEQRIEQFITQFVEDGTVFSFQPWVKDRRKIVDVRIVPCPPDGMDQKTYLLDVFERILPGVTDLNSLDDEGNSWVGKIDDLRGHQQDMDIEIYERENGDDDADELEIELTWTATLYDGPTTVVHQLEDIVVPLRSENLQPIAPQNPFGAPWVARLIRTDFDTIKRRQMDGTYDLLTDEDLEDIFGVLGMRKPLYYVENNEDFLREQKDTKEGRFYLYGGEEAQREWITIIEFYGRWDINGDGLAEEVIFTFFREINKLARARRLTEMYPGLPLRRPFAEARFIPVPGQAYGIGLPELQEGIHDSLHVLVNQGTDAGTIANTPFFFYRASSQLKPEVIRLWPGEGYPLDNPQQDVVFPQFPQRDQEWTFNMIGLWTQFLDKLTQIGPIQQGQVPQGKASALRTTGTTMALLQQGAAMPEQILRRLFMGIKQIWEQYHLLNLRYLPKGKQYIIAGKPMDQDDAYGKVIDPQQISIPIAFDFQATLMNTNKGLVNQALQGLGAALINPLMLQMGIVKPENIYNWAKDYISSNQLDASRYVNKPAGSPVGPRHTAEEVILMLQEGRLPEVAPAEDPIDEHFTKLVKFAQSDELGYFSPEANLLLKQYLAKLQAYMQQQAQQQQMMQAAQRFQTMMGQRGQGQQGSQQPGSPPPTQTQQPSQSEITGAAKGGGANAGQP